MKTTNLLIIFVMVFGQNIFAQKPKWIEYEMRNLTFPEKEYLSGFSSATHTTNNSADEFLNILAGTARTKLIESILVSLQTQTTVNIENIQNNQDAQTKEQFKQISYSLAKANIVGLKIETFYDTKTKSAYAFAYAKRSEVIIYYRNTITKNKTEISQKIQEAKQYSLNNDKENALKSYFECLVLFRLIEEAQAILTAMGSNLSNVLTNEEVNNYKLEVKNGISLLTKGAQLTMVDLCNFLVYGLKIQISELTGSIRLDYFSFENTEITSKFSERLNDNIIKYLTDVKFIATDTKTTKNNDKYTLYGNYWNEVENLKIIANLINNETAKIEASVEGYISKAWLESNNIAYIPEAIEKVEQIGSMTLKPINADIKIKVNKPIKEALEIYASYTDSDGNEKPIYNVPINFSYPNGNILGDAVTSFDGICRLQIDKPNFINKRQIVYAKPDVNRWLNLDSTNLYYQQVCKNINTPVAKFILSIAEIKVCIEADELSLGYKSEMNYVEPKIKDVLSQNGYSFVSDLALAEYLIEIKANTSRKSEVQGLYFVDINCTLSISDLNSGQEIYRNIFSDKGGGLNYQQASQKAYNQISDKIAKEVLLKLQ